jgi:hypothetical protein
VLEKLPLVYLREVEAQGFDPAAGLATRCQAPILLPRRSEQMMKLRVRRYRRTLGLTKKVCAASTRSYKKSERHIISPVS